MSERPTPPTWRREVIALAVFTLAALVVTWPLALTPASATVRSAFGWSHLGLMDMLRDQWVSGRSLIEVYSWELGYPAGGFLILINWLANLLYLPLGTLFEPLLAFNVLMWLELILAGWATWRLCLELGTSEEAAAVGGVLFAASPYALSIVFIGENPNLGLGLLPLTLWVMVLIDTRRSNLLILPAALLLVLSCCTTPYYGVFTAGLLAVYGPVRVAMARGRRLGTFLRYAGVALLACALMAPVIRYYQLLEDGALQYLLLRPATAPVGTPEGVARHLLLNATLTSLFVPGKIELTAEEVPVLHITYLGWVGVALSLAALIYRPRWKTWGWGALLVGSVIFMLGDRLYLDTSPWKTPSGRTLLLPLGTLKTQLAFMENVHVAYRAALVATLCVAVVSALGLTRLLERLQDVALRRGIAALVVWAALGETLLLSPTPWPLRIQAGSVPTFYRELGQQTEDFAILPFPFECQPERDLNRFQIYLYHKTIHRKKLPITERMRQDRSAQTLQGQPQIIDQQIVTDLCSLLDGGEALPPARDLGWFDTYGVQWLVLHEEFLSAAGVDAIRRYMAQYELEQRAWPEEGITTWRLASSQVPPQVFQPLPWVTEYLLDWRVWRKVPELERPAPELWRGAEWEEMGPPKGPPNPASATHGTPAPPPGTLPPPPNLVGPGPSPGPGSPGP